MIRVFEIRTLHRRLVKLNAGKVRQPHKHGFISCKDVIDLSLLAKLHGLDPFWRPVLFVFLIEVFPIDAIWIADKGQWPVLDMTQQDRGHLVIILDDLRLDHMCFREKHLIQVGELDLMLADLRELWSWDRVNLCKNTAEKRRR